MFLRAPNKMHTQNTPYKTSAGRHATRCMHPRNEGCGKTLILHVEQLSDESRLIYSNKCNTKLNVNIKCDSLHLSTTTICLFTNV